MRESQDKLKAKITKLPTEPGVYFFLGPKNKILYIGKATNLKSRVGSYLTQNLVDKRSPLIAKMISEAKNIKIEKTDSVLEALLLESKLIKKFSPPYNSADKDQKSFNFVIITDEKFPRVLTMRERELKKLFFAASLENHGNFLLKISSVRRRRSSRGFSQEDGSNNLGIAHIFGPFPHGQELKEALKIIRKIFPFRDKCSVPTNSSREQLSDRDWREREGIFQQKNTPVARENRFVGTKTKPCFNYQIGLCPGTCIGAVTEKEYKKTIAHLKTFFEGNKKKLIHDLEKEMASLATNREFEKAQQIKRKIFALKHIQDVAMIRDKKQEKGNGNFRIEAYDVAHLSGTNMVGVMTVVENGEAKNSDYRMFKIKHQTGADDTKALKEILERRFKHLEWPLPNLIVADGGLAQLNTTIEVIKNLELNIAVVAVIKDERHKAKTILGIENLKSKINQSPSTKGVSGIENQILLANSEAHRFALKFHRKLRKIG
jgi:excinuclease ABC subunit C